MVQPDIACLQETKLSDGAFPALAFRGLGYDAVHHGEGRWNGVAVLSRTEVTDVVWGFDDGGDPDDQARLLTVRCGDVRVSSVYVPNGRAVGHEHWHYKLRWLDRLRAHIDATSRPDEPVLVCGDINVAASDLDVWSPAAFVGSTHVSPEERDALGRIQEWGLVDVFRELYPDTGGLFSWWDYRAGNFHKHKGMRIDLVLASRPLAARARWALIDRNARKGQQPSDHAPVVVEFTPLGAGVPSG